MPRNEISVLALAGAGLDFHALVGVIHQQVTAKNEILKKIEAENFLHSKIYQIRDLDTLKTIPQNMLI